MSISEAARKMGSVKSEAKAKASRENATRPRPNARKPRPNALKKLADIKCTCSGSGLDHRSYCPRGRAIRYRQARDLPMT